MALISCAVAAKLVCVFDFAYGKSRSSPDAAYMVKTFKKIFRTRNSARSNLVACTFEREKLTNYLRKSFSN